MSTQKILQESDTEKNYSIDEQKKITVLINEGSLICLKGKSITYILLTLKSKGDEIGLVARPGGWRRRARRSSPSAGIEAALSVGNVVWHGGLRHLLVGRSGH